MRHPAGLPAPLALLDRTLVMGIVNVTPDSFSDGGKFFSPEQAIAHALMLVEQGADLVDVGGESTRPGAAEVDSDEELHRVLPVVTALVGQGVPVSVDTRHAIVAHKCLDAGAAVINDVSGGLGDAGMYATLATKTAPYILMHNRSLGASDDQLANYADVLSEVVAELQSRIEAARASGIAADAIVIDPGLGFAKKAHHNWSLLEPDALKAINSLGFPVLLGASRKRFLGTDPDGSAGPTDSMQARDELTVEITARAVDAGIWAVRVHEVAANAELVRSLG